MISFRYKREVPAEIRGTILGVLPKRIVVFWDLYWGLLVLGDYHNGLRVQGLELRVSGARYGLQGLGCRSQHLVCGLLLDASWRQ